MLVGIRRQQQMALRSQQGRRRGQQNASGARNHSGILYSY
jgi:hypothetical protein